MTFSSSSRFISARSIPVPAAASPELQTAIAQPIDELIHIMQQVPQSLDEWRQIIAVFDQASRQRLADLRQRFPVTVEPEEIAGVKTYRLTPSVIAEENQQRLLVHFHGGGYAFANGEIGTGEGILAAYHGQITVISVDYRQCPDHPFPAPIEDAIAVWQTLIQHYEPAKLGMIGTSAGGNLILATLFKLRELNLPFPAAIAPCSPWADLTKTGDTVFINEYIDEIAISYDGLLEGMTKLYAGKEDLKNPFISPVYGNFQGFPPTLLISGTRDLYLSDTVRVHRQLRRAGVAADLHVFEGLSHAEHNYLYDTPESHEAFQEIQLFFNRYLKR